MSTYVMSDIHGQYKSFVKMLNLIRFGEDDKLYVIGDVIDRGPDGIKIIQHLMKMKNAVITTNIALNLVRRAILLMDTKKQRNSSVYTSFRPAAKRRQKQSSQTTKNVGALRLFIST